jgi:hypothetical protein
MGSYLQNYGVDEYRRNRTIKWIILSAIGVAVLALTGYLLFHNHAEKQVVNRFLSHVNAHDFDTAYREWGCTPDHPCANYDRGRFMEDWGPAKKISSPWKISTVEGCKSFVTINVQADGAELQSLAVERDNLSLGFAPSPECQERQWRWRQFFGRILGRS